MLSATSANLHLVADRTRDELVRLRPLTDGSVHEVREPQDIALIRRILRDPTEGDTIRNEAANLLTRSACAELTADLQAVLAHPAEQERFRSFAMQHLGVLWLQGGAKAAGPEHTSLRAGLADRQVMVRREALLALSRGADAVVPAQVAALLANQAAGAEHDLACRIVAERELRDLLPAMRPLLAEQHGEVVRAAALEALGRLGDSASREQIAAAARDPNPRVAQTAQQALAALEGVTP